MTTTHVAHGGDLLGHPFTQVAAGLQGCRAAGLPIGSALARTRAAAAALPRARATQPPKVAPNPGARLTVTVPYAAKEGGETMQVGRDPGSRGRFARAR